MISGLEVEKNDPQKKGITGNWQPICEVAGGAKPAKSAKFTTAGGFRSSLKDI